MEKTLTSHNVTILIKSVLNKDQNHYYYNIFLENSSYLLAKKMRMFFFDSIMILRFGETKFAKEKFYDAKKPINI